MELTQLREGDLRHALRVTVTRMRVRVIAVQALHQLKAGEFAGVLFLVFETGEQLVLDACERIGREGRFANHFRKQLQRRFTLVGGTQVA
ncbi:hypothetical protein D3C72_1571590 [compost metagenome]